MNEWDSAEKKKAEEEEERQRLEDRLTAYYGPALQEQPLPSASWLRLRSQLRPQRSSGQQPGRRWRWRIRRSGRRSTVPTFIEDAFAHILYEARLPYTTRMLSCSFKFQTRIPAVRVFPLGRHNIKLTLALGASLAMEASEMDVLLAGGLARYLSMRKPGYIAGRLLLSSIIPLVWIALVLLWRENVPFLVFPVTLLFCLVLCAVTLWLLHRQGRKMAVQADILMVQWLGRGRACQGLHALAGRTRVPSRKRWGELSLTERIGNVCGTGVKVEHERLTLVR